MEIPKVKKHSRKEFIPDEAGEIKDKRDPEEKPFLISFAKYKIKKCEINDMEKSCHKKALKGMVTIGNAVLDFDDFEKNGIDKIPVKKEGDYKKVYNGLHPEVEIYEHKLSRYARMFYFIENPNKIIHIVLYKNSHYETGKVR